MLIISLSAHSCNNFYQYYMSLKEPTTIARVMGKISITPSSVVKIAKASMTPEQEYYYLLENDIEFKEYINSIKVSNNNPGNLTFYNQPNATREGRWASFETIEAGFRALIMQVQLDQTRNLTLSSFMYKYAPPEENNTEQLIFNMSGRLGLPRETKLNLINTILLAKDITMQENSVKYAN